MRTASQESDTFRVDRGTGNKRRLIRCKGGSKEKRQCWELTFTELENLYVSLKGFFGPGNSPSDVFQFGGFQQLGQLKAAVEEAYERFGDREINLRLEI